MTYSNKTNITLDSSLESQPKLKPSFFNQSSKLVKDEVGQQQLYFPFQFRVFF